MDASLPLALSAGITQLLEGVSRKDLAARAETLSKAYRGGGTSRGVAGEDDALAYLISRLPATYAAVSAAFAAIAKAMPEFAPASLLDAGAGPGAASWAAAQTWDSLRTTTMLDSNQSFLKVARTLAETSEQTALSGAAFVASDLTGVAKQPQADLVVASYVLAELPEKLAPQISETLWNAASQMLVLVEPGTPQGFARILAARTHLLSLGAHIAAPCTHDAGCPMVGKNWCHFSQRLSRTRDHMIAKAASVPFEDERYAYLAVVREAPARLASVRILTEPEDAKPGITLTLCDESGLHRDLIARRDKERFARLRKARWGDAI